MIQKRVEVLNEIPQMIEFLENPVPVDTQLYINQKSKCDISEAKRILPIIKQKIIEMDVFDHENIYEMFRNTATELQVKNGLVMWPARIAISGLLVTPGGAVEIAEIIGKDETIKRLDKAIKELEAYNA